MPNAGEVIRASDLDVPACRVYHDTTQSMADNAQTVVTFNQEDFDNDTMHSTSVNPTRITFTTAGVYLVNFYSDLAAGNDYARVAAEVLLNGATVIGYGPLVDKNATASNGPRPTVTTIYQFDAADYIEIRVFQDNTANAARNLSANASVAAVRLGSGL